MIPVGIVPAGATVRACPECATAVFDQLVRPGQLAALLLAAVPHLAVHCPDVLAALRAAAYGPHTPDEIGCRVCAVVHRAAAALVEHLRATEVLVGQDRLPPAVRGIDDAAAWLQAWAQEGPGPEVMREVMEATATGLAAR